MTNYLTNDQTPLYRKGVGIVLVNGEKKVFLGLRYDSLKNKNQETAWQMPQGGIDDEEAPYTTALRELEEETGVPSQYVTLLDETQEWFQYELPDFLRNSLWNGKYFGQRQKWFLVRLDGDDTLINIDTAHPEFCKWRWATPQEAQEQIVEFKQQLYKDIFKSFEKWF